MRVLPGFGLSLGITLAWLGVIVLLPLAAMCAKALGLSWDELWRVWSEPRVLAALQLSLLAAALAAAINLITGLLLAWVLVRYRFPGRQLADALVDLPFALPTAVAGIALTALYAKTGWYGEPLAGLGISVAFTPLAVVVALTFVTLPFVVRTVQPVIEALPVEIEEAAASLGASRWQTFRRVILPELIPALATGFALAFARGLGEFGSVVFVSGNIPLKTEILPVVIIGKLDQYRIQEATAVALLMLVLSFIMLTVIGLLQRWAQRRAA
ncbi:MAG: sulfate ABC transporter permease subunit CysT [Planctomycetota bacterium]|nr:sulfate ABC transporter permease subunit CysT [Planctomycetota bacterium]MCX8039571.1 sulfate ABC transporter permease subunit CysT [Planctomycetota bacterium]MDW8373819.1 sulfate ABC transporter permease subunit CysT [Planctomycetota bacterium]